MKRETEIQLLEQVCALAEQKSAYLDEHVSHSDVARYIDPQRFERERDAIFRGRPIMAAHVSELEGAGAFLRRNISGLPVLITRADDGSVNAFLNVCRHRGAPLVAEEQGCKQRFSCPYHAWTYNNRGELLAVPHEQQGFPGLDKSEMGLTRLPCTEKYGWIWVVPHTKPAAGAPNIDQFLGGLATDFEWLAAQDLRLAQRSQQRWNMNWKIGVEGGIEAYHFRVAHRNTIAPFFHDNLSTYQTFGPHFRSVLPRSSTVELKNIPKDQWQIRKHTNLLYSLLPSSQLLVQEDHIVWIRGEPLAADCTELTLCTLAPKNSERSDEHWAKNHDITVRTLTEDFELGQGIQQGLASGANVALTFGRFEGALGVLNRMVDELITNP